MKHLGVLLLLGCGASSTATDGGDCSLAFNGQFAGFRSWSSYTFDGGAADDAGVHIAGPRTEYINQLPSAGDLAFAQGTLIVKEVGVGTDQHHLFAMVKRGCDFNATGAHDWEWLELKESGTTPLIIWRGVGPPAGELYGGDPAGCNGCHVGCASNDFVCSPHLRLSSP
jgi:hypothetical protein